MDVKKKWIKALRSDKYIQTRMVYRTKGKTAHCALGVLLDIACESEQLIRDIINLDPIDSHKYIETRFGIPENLQRLVEGWNDDDGYTFPQIAEKLEEKFS